MPRTRTNKNQLPKTTQVTSTIDRDDGYYQEGWPKAGALAVPRFIDNGDNTITDRATNLQWIKRPELIIPDGLNAANTGVEKGDYDVGTTYDAGDIVTDSGSGNAYISLVGSNVGNSLSNPTYWIQSIWATTNGSGGVNPVYFVWDYTHGDPNALDLGVHASPGLTKSGKSDWKCPNLKELISIVDYGQSGSPTIDPIFANCQGDYYWSSTVYAPYTSGAWFVYFYNGNVYSYTRYYDFYVRPVRQY